MVDEETCWKCISNVEISGSRGYRYILYCMYFFPIYIYIRKICFVLNLQVSMQFQDATLIWSKIESRPKTRPKTPNCGLVREIPGYFMEISVKVKYYSLYIPFGPDKCHVSTFLCVESSAVLCMGSQPDPIKERRPKQHSKVVSTHLWNTPRATFTNRL